MDNDIRNNKYMTECEKQIYSRMWGTKYISFNNLSGRRFVFNLYIYLTEVAKNALNYLHTQVASLDKKSLKNIVCGSGYFKYIQWYNAALDSTESKLI